MILIIFKGAKSTEVAMNIPVIRHKQKKPNCLPEVLKHFEAIVGNKIDPKSICMIGIIYQYW